MDLKQFTENQLKVMVYDKSIEFMSVQQRLQMEMEAIRQELRRREVSVPEKAAVSQ